jgi:hypothetical protein
VRGEPASFGRAVTGPGITSFALLVTSASHATLFATEQRGARGQTTAVQTPGRCQSMNTGREMHS